MDKSKLQKEVYTMYGRDKHSGVPVWFPYLFFVVLIIVVVGLYGLNMYEALANMAVELQIP